MLNAINSLVFHLQIGPKDSEETTQQLQIITFFHTSNKGFIYRCQFCKPFAAGVEKNPGFFLKSPPQWVLLDLIGLWVLLVFFAFLRVQLNSHVLLR